MLSNIIKNSKKALALTTLSLAVGAVSSIAMANEKPGDGVRVKPIFPSIAEERFRGEIVIQGLTDLGYKVSKPKETEYATMMLAVSYGDADFSVHLWDILHDSFYQKAGGDDTMVKTGKIIPGVLQGYLIDKKTSEKYGITSLTDLKDPAKAALFDNNGDGKADLTGCNPGWGCELVIDHHLKAYGLEETVSHNRGSYFALMADTITNYQAGKPILYFTWAPQWISGVLVPEKDTVWLSVPYTDLPGGDNTLNTSFNGKNLGFAVDTVKGVINRDFAKQNPAAVKFISMVTISADDESAQNLKMKDGENSLKDIKRHASDWINAHRDSYNAWLAAARQG